MIVKIDKNRITEADKLMALTQVWNNAYASYMRHRVTGSAYWGAEEANKAVDEFVKKVGLK